MAKGSIPLCFASRDFDFLAQMPVLDFYRLKWLSWIIIPGRALLLCPTQPRYEGIKGCIVTDGHANGMPVLMSTIGSPPTYTHCPQLNVLFASFAHLSGFRELLTGVRELNLLRFGLLLCQVCTCLSALGQGAET